MPQMIFTSHQRFFKKRQTNNTRTITFNDEPVSHPLMHVPVSVPSQTQTQDIWSVSVHTQQQTKSLTYMPPPPPAPAQIFKGPMLRTVPGQGKRSCCGGAV